MYRVDCQLV